MTPAEIQAALKVWRRLLDKLDALRAALKGEQP